MEGGGPRLGVDTHTTPMWGAVSRGGAPAWPATSPEPENPLGAGIVGGVGKAPDQG